MSESRAVRGIVSGRVQGVAYRASFQRRGAVLGLAGWVRNRPDGTVEFLIQGEAGSVAEMVRWARTGPALARVADVRLLDVEHDPGLVSLEIRT